MWLRHFADKENLKRLRIPYVKWPPNKYLLTRARCSHGADGLPLVFSIDTEVRCVAGEAQDGAEPVGDVEEAVVGLPGEAGVEEGRVHQGGDADAALPPRVLFANEL